jgi:hypothetical protein
MSFWKKIDNALNKTASFLEEINDAPKKQALKDGYNEYMNGRIKSMGSGFGCSYSDSMALNNLYEKGAYKAYQEECAKRPIPSSTGNTVTYRDKYGNISGSSTKNGDTITYRDRNGNISGSRTKR